MLAGRDEDEGFCELHPVSPARQPHRHLRDVAIRYTFTIVQEAALKFFECCDRTQVNATSNRIASCEPQKTKPGRWYGIVLVYECG
jgi:hypothetical protein